MKFYKIISVLSLLGVLGIGGYLVQQEMGFQGDITSLTGYTGKVGDEDVNWGTPGVGVGNEETFSVPTYTGGSTTLTKIYDRDIPIIEQADDYVHEVFMRDSDKSYDVDIFPKDIITQGPWTDARVYSATDLSTIETELGGDGIEHYILLAGVDNDTPFTVTGNISFSDNLHFFSLPDSLLIANGVTVTVTGSFSAGLYRVVQGNGTLLIERQAVTALIPQWFGVMEGAGISVANGDLNSDYMQKLFDDYDGGYTVLFSSGRFGFSSEMQITDEEYHIRGCGNSGSSTAHLSDQTTTLYATSGLLDENFLELINIASPSGNYVTGSLSFLDIDMSEAPDNESGSNTDAATIFVNQSNYYEIHHVNIYKPPKVAIYSTGNEVRVYRCEMRGRCTQPHGLTPTKYEHSAAYLGPDSHWQHNWIQLFDDGLHVYGGNASLVGGLVDRCYGTGLLVSGDRALISNFKSDNNCESGAEITGNYSKFTNCQFKGNGRDPLDEYGVAAESGVEIRGNYATFVNCEFGNKREQDYSDNLIRQQFGAYVYDGADHPTYTSCKIYDNRNHGIYFEGGSVGLDISHSKFWDNGYADASDPGFPGYQKYGLVIGGSGAVSGTVASNEFWTTDSTNFQIHGIHVSNSDADDLSFSDNYAHDMQIGLNLLAGIISLDDNRCPDNSTRGIVVDDDVYAYGDFTIETLLYADNGGVCTGATTFERLFFHCPDNANGCVLLDALLGANNDMTNAAAPNWWQIQLQNRGTDGTDTDSIGSVNTQVGHAREIELDAFEYQSMHFLNPGTTEFSAFKYMDPGENLAVLKTINGTPPSPGTDMGYPTILSRIAQY